MTALLCAVLLRVEGVDEERCASKEEKGDRVTGVGLHVYAAGVCNRILQFSALSVLPHPS